MMRTWIVVADSVVAHVFETSVLGAPMRTVTTLTHPEGRLHGRDLETSAPGGAASSTSSNRVSYRDAGPVEHEHLRFAAEIAQLLDDARRHGRCDAIWLVMPARLLGRVRGEMTTETARLVRGALDRRLVDADEERLRTCLQELRG